MEKQSIFMMHLESQNSEHRICVYSSRFPIFCLYHFFFWQTI